jgi:hypothetical protein
MRGPLVFMSMLWIMIPDSHGAFRDDIGKRLSHTRWACIHPRATRAAALHQHAAVLIWVGARHASQCVMPRVVQYIAPSLGPTHAMPIPPPTTYRQASVSTDIHQLSIYPYSPPRPVLRRRKAHKTHDGDAGRWTEERQTTCPVCRTLVHGAHTQRRQAAPSSSGHTISPHAGRRSLYLGVSACLPLAHHQGSCQAPSLLLHSYHSGSSRICIHLHGGRPRHDIATPAGCMHMPPTVCPLLEPTDRHAGHTQACDPLVFTLKDSRFMRLDSHHGGIAISTLLESSPPAIH